MKNYLVLATVLFMVATQATIFNPDLNDEPAGPHFVKAADKTVEEVPKRVPVSQMSDPSQLRRTEVAPETYSNTVDSTTDDEDF